MGSTGAGATLLVLGVGLLACEAFTQEAGAAGLDGGPRPGKASTCFALAGRVGWAGARGPYDVGATGADGFGAPS